MAEETEIYRVIGVIVPSTTGDIVWYYMAKTSKTNTFY